MKTLWCWWSFALAVLASSVIGEEGLSMRIIAEMPEVVEGDPIEVDVAGSLVAVASEVELRLIDISDPEVPVLRGTLAIEAPIDLATNGKVVALITEGRALHLVDVRQPDHPRLATVLEPEPFGPTDHLEYESVDFDERGFLYVVRNFDYRGYYGRLHVYNVDAPDGPQEIGVGTTGFALGKVAVSGDRAYASGLFLSSDWTMGINLWAIFDISSPGSPEFCTRIDWAGWVEGFTVPEDSSVDVAAHGAGAIGFSQAVRVSGSRGPLSSRLLISGDCPPSATDHDRGVRSDRRSVAASADAFFVSETYPSERRLRAIPRGVGLGASLPSIEFRSMATVGNLLIGVDDGTPELRIILVEVSNVVQWGSAVTGLWDANVNWQPAVVPGADSDVLFPAFFGPGIDAYTVTRITSSDPFVRSLTLEGGDVTIASATGLADGAFAITDRMALEGGVLRLTHPLVDGLTGGRLVSVTMPDDFTTTDARLEIHDRVRVSSGSTTVLDPGDRVQLVGSSSETPKASWGAIGSDVLLTPWTNGVPKSDAGEPQLEIQGQGAIEGDLINEGWLRLAPLDADRPGEVATYESGLSIEGDYVQSESGVLEVRLGQAGGHLGDAPPLLVKGRATIDGTLRLSKAPGYTPTPGDHFTILLAGEGIDLGDGLSASGEPTRPTIEQRGFRVIEGILDTGDPNVFWGVDYNQRRAGEHVIQVVALRVPWYLAGASPTSDPIHTLRGDAKAYTPSVISSRGSVRNLIMISHGTADGVDASGRSPLGEIAIGMRRVIELSPRQSEYEVLLLDWSAFATNALEGPVRDCFGFTDGVHVDNDSRNRPFDPFESARFGQQYARSLLSYFAECRFDLGAFSSVHTMGHSSGAFVADGILKVLANNASSPFNGEPSRTHLTLLDPYLPPASGGACIRCTGRLPSDPFFKRCFEGHELGELGGSSGSQSSTDMEQFFYDDWETAGTNNEIEYRTANDLIAFEVTDYFRRTQRGTSGHNAPIRYYRDSVYTVLNEPLMVESPNGVERRKVLVKFGAVFSPLFNDLRIGRRLEEAWQQASREEILDRDIDVVRAFRLDLLVFEMIITGFDSRGTDSARLSSNGVRMRTNSPAMATFSTPVEGAANAVTFDILRTEGMGGRLLVSLQGDAIDLIPLDDLGIGVGDRLSYAIDIDPIDPGHVALEFMLEDTFGPVEIEIHDLAFALVDRTFDDGVPSSTPIRASGGPDGSLLATWVDPDGRPVLFSYDALANGWTEWSEGQTEFGAALDAVSIHDPKSDESFVGLASSQGVVLLDPGSPDTGIVNLTESLASTGATPIVRATTTLTSQDGLVFIAGLDEADDLVMYWQTGQVDASGLQIWAFTNLDRDHLEPQGLMRPAWRGGITSYVTSWNGLNIAGLDDTGDIWSVWWAPGLTQWRVDNLSAITGAEPIVGGLTAYVTPWGGINLVGMDARGEVVVTWWVPQFDDEWQQQNLSRTLEHPGMIGDSLASYVTPWGGTNIAGTDEAGDLVVYWWSPESVDWQVSPLSALVPNAVLPLRSIEGLASPTGLISLFGFTDGEEPVRYHWSPGGSWNAELLRGP